MSESIGEHAPGTPWHARLGEWFHGLTRKVAQKGTELKQKGAELKTQAANTVAAVQETAKVEPAIASLRGDLANVAEAAADVRRAVEAQGRQQEELSRYVSALPDLLRAVPDRLGTMDERLAQQIERQDRIDDVLARLTGLLNDQRQTAGDLAAAIDTLAERTQSQTGALSQVQQTLASLAGHSENSAQSLRRIEDQFRARDAQGDAATQRQNARMARLLTGIMVVMLLLLAGVVAVGVMVWQTRS